MASLDVLTFQAIDNRSTHDGNLVLGFLNQRIGLDETRTHLEVDVNHVALLELALDDARMVRP